MIVYLIRADGTLTSREVAYDAQRIREALAPRPLPFSFNDASLRCDVRYRDYIRCPSNAIPVFCERPWTTDWACASVFISFPEHRAYPNRAVDEAHQRLLLFIRDHHPQHRIIEDLPPVIMHSPDHSGLVARARALVAFPDPQLQERPRGPLESAISVPLEPYKAMGQILLPF